MRLQARLSYIKILLKIPKGLDMEVALAQNATIADFRKEVEFMTEAKLFMEKYTNSAGRLSTAQVSDQEELATVLENQQLLLRINKEELGYEYTRGDSKTIPQRIVGLALSDYFQKQFTKKSSQASVPAQKLKQVFKIGFGSDVFGETFKGRVAELKSVYQKKKAVVELLKAEEEKQKQEAESKALKSVGWMTNLAVLQFAGLFYITYGVYGWDVGQPVSYLLGLSAELWVLQRVMRNKPFSREQLYLQKLQQLSSKQDQSRARRLRRMEEALLLLDLK